MLINFKTYYVVIKLTICYICYGIENMLIDLLKLKLKFHTRVLKLHPRFSNFPLILFELVPF